MGAREDRPRKVTPPTVAVHLRMPTPERNAVLAVAELKGQSANQWARMVLKRAADDVLRQMSAPQSKAA